MTGNIKLEASALKALKKLDAAVRRRIEDYIDRLAEEENPRAQGIAPVGQPKTV